MNAGDLVAGKYRLTRNIGVGAMGEVWAAIHERTHGEVALKLILNPNPELRARLLREARAYGSLRHPNVVDIYDVGETERGDPFLVMELLSGETLAERLAREGRLAPRQAAAIAHSVARALRAAHAKGIIHRDLKPANVFLHREADREAEQLKVLDFGVSKNLAGDDATSTATGVLVGSPAYMSPEQARGEKDLDQRTDLWSLGVVLFEMIAGRRPFPSKSPYMAIAEVLSASIPSLAAEVPGVSEGLSSVALRCLTRDRAARVASADELLGLLRPFTDDLVTTGDGLMRMSALPDASPTAPAPQVIDPRVEPPTEVLDVGAYPVRVVSPAAEGPLEAQGPGPAADVPPADPRPEDERTTVEPAEPAPPPQAPRGAVATLARADEDDDPTDDDPTDDDLRRTTQLGRPIVVPGATASTSTTPLVRPPLPAPASASSPPSRTRGPALLGAGVAALIFFVGILLVRTTGGPRSEAPVTASSAAAAADPPPAPEPAAPEPPIPEPAQAEPPATTAEGSEPPPDPSAAPGVVWQPRKGKPWLVFQSTVPARVFLDGTPIGVTPLAPTMVTPGAHRIVFRHTLLGERVSSVQVKAGDVTRVTADFAAKPRAR
jgi:serine/threonine-protein kinase